MEHKPIKLVVLLQDLEFGGTQRYAINLLKHLDRQLFAPELWVLRGGHDLVPGAKETNVRIVRLSKSSRVVGEALRDGQVDVVRRVLSDGGSIMECHVHG